MRLRASFAVALAMAAFACAVTPALAGFTPASGSPITVAGPTNLRDIATGDLNGDTIPDLAVVNYAAGNVTVLYGNGDGTFSGATAVSTGAGSPHSVAIGNLDADADADLAVANVGSVSILLNNGLGGFPAASGSPISVPGAGQGENSIAIGNINGGPGLDIAATAYNVGTVALLLGNGDGTFAAGTPFGYGNPYAVTIADLNGADGLDIAFTELSGRTVASYLGDGAGGFTFKSFVPALGGLFPYSVKSGNLDGDADTDLIVPYTNGSSHTMFLYNDGTGNIAYAGDTNIGAAALPLDATFGSFDGDAAQDVATSGQGTSVAVSIGPFPAAFGYPSSLYPTGGGGNVFGIATSDFNGDGFGDIATANNTGGTVSVLLNAIARLGFTPSSHNFGTQAQTTIGPAQTITVENTGLGDQATITKVRTSTGEEDDFLITRDDCTGEVLDSGETCEVRVRFAPGAAGTRTTDLRVEYTGSKLSPDSMTLSGFGGSLPQGPQGPTGNTGATGATGPAGPQGPPGRDATVTCRGKKGKKPKCTIVFSAGASTRKATASLSRGGAVYARGSAYVDEGTAKVPLVAKGPVPAGRYLLKVKVAYGKGKTAVTKRKVTVG
jgi:hypothetical protein